MFEDDLLFRFVSFCLFVVMSRGSSFSVFGLDLHDALEFVFLGSSISCLRLHVESIGSSLIGIASIGSPSLAYDAC
jgi:hypothetical protein